ncbi:DUF1435 domain-containing protein [Yersinia pestis]|nr:hypothetical protein CH59_1437 [Yersinia pestis]EDR34092.1 putative membrane protein [Yersinia pestis biovar Orientalis str. IP275]EDR38028.1 putative membrane protein [Yersinia pestis biovar Orientalis str. F1991016]EDR58744.1 putative membrane protein [Yersinia pestis biovar Orientalis str. MG05-1020]KNX88813.1 hypothetical protein ACX52_1413 [Yersinia pestis]
MILVMIIIIIIIWVGIIMITSTLAAYRSWGITGLLSRGMSSGWGILLPFTLLPVLGWVDISIGQLRILIVVAMLATVSMLYHVRLRHFLLLPSCLALLGGLVALMLMHGGVS